MKFSILAAVALACHGATKTAAKYRPFGTKASKTRKSQHGVFAPKSGKSDTQSSTTVGEIGSFTSGSVSSMDEGREEKNSEDGGLVIVNGTVDATDTEVDDDSFKFNETIDTFDDDDNISSPSDHQDFDPVTAMFGWLKECARADIDEDTCLVTETLKLFVEMEGSGDDDDLNSRRFLQGDDGCRPELSRQDLWNVMNVSREECNKVSIGYSDEEFGGILGEFWTIFNDSDDCWEEVCNSPDIFFKLMFDHAAQCASVNFDVDQCVMDEIFAVFFAEEPSYYDDDHYVHEDGTHRTLRSLQGAVHDDEGMDCIVVNEIDLAFFASFVLSYAQGRCAEQGVLVTAQDISKTSTDIVQLFGATHCWGGPRACPDDDLNDMNDDVFEYDDDEFVYGINTTVLANGTSYSPETNSTTQFNSTTNKAFVASSDDYPGHDDEGTIGNSSTFANQTSAIENEVLLNFNNGTNDDTIDESDEADVDNADHVLSSTMGESIMQANETSIEGSINTTLSGDDEDEASGAIEEDADDSPVSPTPDNSYAQEDVYETNGEIGANSHSEDNGNETSTEYDQPSPSPSTEEDANATTPINIQTDGNGSSTESDNLTKSIPSEIVTTSTLNTTIPPSDNPGNNTLDVIGESCDVGTRSDASERAIEVPYFYIIETIVLEGVVDEIEGMLHLMTCINGFDRRLSIQSDIVAVESSPKDVVSTEYVCEAQYEGADCNVIEGMSTLIAKDVDSVEEEDELKMNFYSQLEEIFDMLSSMDDPNIVLLDYVGSDPSSLSKPADLIEEEKVATNDSFSLFKFVAIGASVVTLAMLIVGAWKLKEKNDKDTTPEGKPIDDKSVAVETAAMTAFTMNTSTSGSADETSSDIASDISSTVDAKEFYKNKAFVLAEDEESNWRNLGILPNQLDDIREEFSQSGSELADERSM